MNIQSFTLGDLSGEQRRNWPGTTAVVDGKVRLSFAELDERVNRLSAAFAAEGVTVGDRVAWLAQNSFRLLETLLACAKLGAICCPVNWRLTPAEATEILEDLQPRLVLAQEAEIPASRVRVAAGATWVSHDGDGAGDYEARLGAASAAEPSAAVDGDQPVLLIATGAFQGRSHGALISHTAVLAQSMVMAMLRRIGPGFTYLNCGPMYHVGMLMFTLATFHMGGTNVFQPRFDADEACLLVERERCQGAFLIPPIIDAMVAANESGRYDLSSLQSNDPPDAWRAMVSRDTSPWGQQPGGYGQTEVMGMLTFGALGIGAIGAHGRPSPLMRLRILDAEGRELPAGEVGEIATRGLHAFNGYFRRPALNERRLVEGWHRTGDLGRREPDGSITFIGPKTVMIKSGAENIYPAEVEATLRQHPAVADCAVIGVPDPVWSQRVLAVIQPEAGTTPTEQELAEFCRQRIAGYKVPRIIRFAPTIPRAGATVDYPAVNAQFGGGGYPGE